MTIERAKLLLALAQGGDKGEAELRTSATPPEYRAARHLGQIARLSMVLGKKHKPVDSARQEERKAELQKAAGKLASEVGLAPALEILKAIGVEV